MRQVRELLGEPHAQFNRSGRDVFSYGGFGKCRWCSMEIYFGEDGRVSGKFHDH